MQALRSANNEYINVRERIVRMKVLNIYTLREKCPNAELFLVRIFPHSDWIRRDRPNAGKYRPEITPYLDTFHTVIYIKI